MKKTIFILLFICSFRLFSIEISPVNFYYTGIEVKNDTVIAYGTFGYSIISYDNGNSWKQKKIFSIGSVQTVIIEDNRYVAFSETGEIAVSNDKGMKWYLFFTNQTWLGKSNH